MTFCTVSLVAQQFWIHVNAPCPPPDELSRAGDTSLLQRLLKQFKYPLIFVSPTAGLLKTVIFYRV